MYSGNLDGGESKVTRARVAADLKPSDQDELILGIDQVVNANWKWGVKGTYRQLLSVVDLSLIHS